MSKTQSLPVSSSVWGQTLGRHCYSTDQQSQRASTHGFRDAAEKGGMLLRSQDTRNVQRLVWTSESRRLGVPRRGWGLWGPWKFGVLSEYSG